VHSYGLSPIEAGSPSTIPPWCTYYDTLVDTESPYFSTSVVLKLVPPRPSPRRLMSGVCVHWFNVLRTCTRMVIGRFLFLRSSQSPLPLPSPRITRCTPADWAHCCHICARPGLTPDSSLSVVCGFQITRLDVNAAGLTKSPQNSHAGKSAKLHTSAKDLATSAHDFARSRKSATSAQHSSPPAYMSVTNMCAPTR
jgi:hypothetical protein